MLQHRSQNIVLSCRKYFATVCKKCPPNVQRWSDQEVIRSLWPSSTEYQQQKPVCCLEHIYIDKKSLSNRRIDLIWRIFLRLRWIKQDFDAGDDWISINYPFLRSFLWNKILSLRIVNVSRGRCYILEERKFFKDVGQRGCIPLTPANISEN